MTNEIEIVVKGRRDASTKAAFDGVERDAKQASRSIGETFSGLKGKMAAAGAAAGIALLAGVGEALEQGQQTAKTAAQLGMTDPDQIEGFGRTAGKLYSSAFASSIEQGNQAIRQVVGAGILSEDATEADIQKISEKALTLANVFDQDLGKSVAAVQQMIRTGLARDADEAFDLITTGIQQGVDKAGDLNDTIIEYSTQFRELGISGPKALGLISQGLKAGARDADTVADGLKEIAIRAQDGTDASRAAFKSLGLDADVLGKAFASGGESAEGALDTVLKKMAKVEDPMEKNAIAVGLFGTKAEDLQDALFALNPDTAVMAMGKVAGATDKAGKAMSDAAKNDLTVMWREMKQKLVDFLQQRVIPAVRDLAHWIRDDLVPAISTMVRWVKDNQTWLVPLATAILSVVVAAKAAAVASDLWRNSFDLLNKVVGMNPLVRLIGLITGVVTWFVTAYQTSETFRNKVNGAVAAVRDFFIGAWNKITGAWAAVKKFFTETIPGWIKAGWDYIYNAVVGPWKKAYKDIQRIALDALGGIIPEEARVKIEQKLNASDAIPAGASTTSYKNKPRTPGSAHGGIASGWRQVNERGAELIKLPAGSHVYPAEQTSRMMGGGGSKVDVEIFARPDSGHRLMDEIVRALKYDIRTRGAGDVVGYFS